jgi:hypothetical protein
VCNGLETCDSLTAASPARRSTATITSELHRRHLRPDSAAGGHTPSPEGAPCDDGTSARSSTGASAARAWVEELEFIARTARRIGGESVIDGNLLVNEPGGIGKLGPDAQMTTARASRPTS